MTVSGIFDVQVTPLESVVKGGDGINPGRMAITKRFHGALDAESKGEMLTLLTPVSNSAGYVAIEVVHGTLEGRRGGFALQHFGTMARGVERLVLEVVPDSGTGELSGIKGLMGIWRDNGKHFYDFEYEL